VIVYVDGVEVDSAQDTTSNFIGSNPIDIGNLRGGFFYEGIVDEVAIYNRALTAAQIARQYDNGDPEDLGNSYSYSSHDDDNDGIVDENDNCPNDYNPERNIAACSLVIVSEPTTRAVVDINYSYDVNSSDDPNAVFSLTEAPPSMEINATTGVITWKPTSAGDFNVTVEAYSIMSATQSFTISVRDLGILPEDMTHYWRFDETDGSPYLDSYGITDGTCNGSECPAAATGRVNGAQEFYGSQHDKVTITYDGTFNWGVDDSFTMQAWIKRGSEEITEDEEVIIARDAPGTNKSSWYISVNKDGKVEFFLRDAVSNRISFIDSGSPVTDNNWHHITIVRDTANDKVSLYVDGDESNSSEDNTGEFTGDDAVNIGYFNDNVNPLKYYFNGIIDEVAIYDRALTPAQIKRQYINGNNGDGYGSVDIDGDGIYDESDNCPTVANADQNASMCKPAPQITTSPVTEATVNSLYRYDVNTTNVPDVEFLLEKFPSGMTIDSTTGLISWTPTLSGEYNITVIARNGAPTQDDQNFTIIVSDVPPEITTTPVVTGSTGEPYSYDVDAVSVPAVTYSLGEHPAGMTIDSSSGIISWSPNAAGYFNVTVVASNGFAPDANQSYRLRIVDVSNLPANAQHYWPLDEWEGLCRCVQYCRWHM
jgi:hypothetical protein